MKWTILFVVFLFLVGFVGGGIWLITNEQKKVNYSTIEKVLPKNENKENPRLNDTNKSKEDTTVNNSDSKEVKTTELLKLKATIDFEGKFEVGSYSLNCVFINNSETKSFYTKYVLDNNFNELLQFYMLLDGHPLENPRPISVAFPYSLPISSFNIPFSLKPDEIKPGEKLKLLERAIGFKKKGLYAFWFTLFLPNSLTNVEDFVNNEVGTTLKSNVIRVRID